METIGNYTVRNKDIPLIRFSLLREISAVLGTDEPIYKIRIDDANRESIHLFPSILKRELTEETLLSWITSRKAPKNRRFVDKILHAIEDSRNPLRYVDISHALSLNDTLWITNDLVNEKWKDFSLYQHPFNEILSYVAFTGFEKKISGVISSPELTSSGALKKCWTSRKDGIYLMKGDDVTASSDGRSQAVMEYYAQQIADVMGFPHITYDLEKFSHHDSDEEIVCLCKLFTSEDVGYSTAYEYFLSKGIDVNKLNPSDLPVQEKMAIAFGLESYQDMMLFDSLILNRDRHLGNFGYLVDNNTGEYLRPAPLFDNGFSLLVGAAAQDINDINNYLESLHGKYLDFDLMARLFVQPRHSKGLRSLTNFNFKKHPKYNVPDKVLNAMSYAVQQRAKKALLALNLRLNKEANKEKLKTVKEK